jgi:endonuclease YncB( thermonuclease family)
MAGLLMCVLVVALAGCGSVAVPEETVSEPPSTTVTSTTQAQETSTTVTSTTTIALTTTTTRVPVTTTTKPSPIVPGGELAVLVSITDGDTIDVRLADGTIDTVRLIGINTPERGECFADEATAALTSLLAGEIVMTSDVSDRDQYDRLLRYIWDLDGGFINEQMVEGGFALAREYPPDIMHSATLSAAQDLASKAQRGLWAPDACGATAEASVEIGHIEYDAPGNDHDNLNGEWVELSNTGSGSLTMTGWVLKDESASHRYRFPSGFSLAAGASVSVYTGCGTNTATNLYWCNGSAVWNNDGDTAFIVDDAGNIVDSKSY